MTRSLADPVLGVPIVVSALAIAMFSGVVAAQTPARPSGPQGRFEDRQRVLEVQVPVNVTARDGSPIRGLEAKNFGLTQDGVDQQIIGFEVVDLDVIEPDPRRLEDAEASIPSAARRYFLFLFDLSFSAPTSVVRAREAARTFVLTSMHPTDLAAVATHSIEGGPKLIMTFSPDRAQLARAIDTLGAPRLTELKNRDPLRFLVDLPEIAERQVSPDVGGEGSQIQQNTRLALATYLGVISNQIRKMEKSYARGRISAWTSSMADMARLLGAIEGRKHVVYFSEGFDGRLLLGRQPDFDDPDMQEDDANINAGQYAFVDNDDRFGNTQLHGDMQQMLTQFRNVDAVIQAVDISGLSADLPSERRARRVGRDALFYIANDTGGTLFEEANDFGHQLASVLERSSVTYVLSFKPSVLGAPGDFHRLKVRVDAPGARVSARSAFQVPARYEELHPFERGLLAADQIATATPKNDLAMNVLASAFRANEGEAYVPVIIELGGPELLAGNDGDQLSVELFAYVTDEHNQMKDFFSQLISLELTNRRQMFAATGLKYYGHVTLVPGRYLVRVLARNSTTGRTAVRTARVDVPEYGDLSASLLPPFFLEAPGTWFLVREQPGSDVANASRPYPFTVNGEPYVPSARPELGSGIAAPLCVVGYNLGDGDLEVEGSVRTADGSPVAAGAFVFQERTVTGISGLDKLLATFDPDGLAAGDYRLEVSVRNPALEVVQQSSIPFRVSVPGDLSSIQDPATGRRSSSGD